MKKTTTFLATTLFCLTLGACATTDDTPKTVEGTDPHQIPSHAARQNDVAYSDISSNATITEVATVDKTVDASTVSVENPPAPTTDTWTSTSSTNNSGMTSGSTSSSTGTMSNSTTGSTSNSTNSTSSSTSTDPNWTDGSKIDTSMASSSSVSQDTQSSTSSTDDTSATSTRTRMRKD